MRWVFYSLILVLLHACVSPVIRNEHYVAAQGSKRFDIGGTDFTHTVLINHKSKQKTWHIYIEGDGKPWIDHRVIATDPTTKKPLMMRLMTQDKSSAIYLGRPCYHRKTLEDACHPLYWTHSRYSEIVVASMAEVLNKLVREYDLQEIVLIGHSGGGTLAMLLAERVPETAALVTIAGNLDINAWADFHGYSRLSGSLNPAQRKPLSSSIRQYHYLGKLDQNIKTWMILPTVNKQINFSWFLLNDHSHDCCWEKDWETILTRL